MKSYPFIVSCDWFAYSCTCEASQQPHVCDEIVHTSEVRLLDNGGAQIQSFARRSPELNQRLTAPGCPHTFIIKESPEHHPYYESSACAYVGKAPLAHLFYRCKRADQPFSCQVKVDNSRLYYYGWDEQLWYLIQALGWKISHVNRIDVCVDFNLMAGGRVPLRFVQDYLSEPTAQRPSFIRHSSNKARAVLTRRVSCIDYHTLSWGTRDSAVQVNLYNKSLELQEKTFKPWIVERWNAGGLHHDPAGTLTGKPWNVWRLEFSINPSAVCLRKKPNANLHFDDDLVREIGIHDVATPEMLLQTFRILLPAYFTFHVLTKEAQQAGRRVKDLPTIQLFNVGLMDDEGDAVMYKPACVRYFKKSTRTDRLLLNRLLDNYESADLNVNERAAFQVVIDKLIEFYNEKRDVLQRVNLADDVLDEFLRESFGAGKKKTMPAVQSVKRKASRWVRMLRGVHSRDILCFEEALAQLETLEDTDLFKSCLAFAQHVSFGAMPDEAISQWVDEDAERCYLEDRAAQDMLVSESAKNTRPQAEDTYENN